MSLILLNLAGGGCAEDLRVLAQDDGFCKIMRRVETAAMPRKEHRRCVPSRDFGGNAAWWRIMSLALNLNGTMKRFALGKRWVSKRMQAIRFNLINLPGRIVERSRRLL